MSFISNTFIGQPGVKTQEQLDLEKKEEEHAARTIQVKYRHKKNIDQNK